jgi:hypothetical protein
MIWLFPFKNKSIVKTSDSHSFTTVDRGIVTEVPVNPHPGGYMVERKMHIHKGVDLYCNTGEPVYAVEEGFVLAISLFTGEKHGSPWWNETYAVLVKGNSGIVVYGEIDVKAGLTVGTVVARGDCLGTVIPVLKEDKGRPMAMLHLELCRPKTFEPLTFREIENFADPTSYLLEAETH